MWPLAEYERGLQSLHEVEDNARTGSETTTITALMKWKLQRIQLNNFPSQQLDPTYFGLYILSGIRTPEIPETG